MRSRANRPIQAMPWISEIEKHMLCKTSLGVTPPPKQLSGISGRWIRKSPVGLTNILRRDDKENRRKLDKAEHLKAVASVVQFKHCSKGRTEGLHQLERTVARYLEQPREKNLFPLEKTLPCTTLKKTFASNSCARPCSTRVGWGRLACGLGAVRVKAVQVGAVRVGAVRVGAVRVG